MPNNYTKYFDSWNFQKKSVNEREIADDFYYHEREVWWASVGVNIGAEIDGKNENFERPILIIRKINQWQFLGIPLTSKYKSGYFYIPVQLGDAGQESTICLSQIRVFSTKRLNRKIGTIRKEDFLNVKIRLVNYISYEENYKQIENTKTDPEKTSGSSEAAATNV